MLSIPNLTSSHFNWVEGRDTLYLICGEWRLAKIDVCLVDCLQNVIPLVQEKRPRSRLISKAIAALNYSNKHATSTTVESKACDSHKLGGVLHPPTVYIMPLIVISGTTPTFYKFP